MCKYLRTGEEEPCNENEKMRIAPLQLGELRPCSFQDAFFEFLFSIGFITKNAQEKQAEIEHLITEVSESLEERLGKKPVSALMLSDEDINRLQKTGLYCIIFRAMLILCGDYVFLIMHGTSE